jgi:hypothetical protein
MAAQQNKKIKKNGIGLPVPCLYKKCPDKKGLLQQEKTFFISLLNKLSFSRNDANVRFSVRSLFESYLAISECEEGMVFTQAYVNTWMVLSTSLSYDDVTGDNNLAAKFLDT